MSGVKGTPKERKKERKKKSEALSETDGLCSSEHGLWGIGFGGSPIGYAGFMSCFKVQGNFLLLCSSNNFVGYSYAVRRTHFPSPLYLTIFPIFPQILSPNLEEPQLNGENSPNYPRETSVWGDLMSQSLSDTHPPLAPGRSSTSPEGSAPLK